MHHRQIIQFALFFNSTQDSSQSSGKQNGDAVHRE